jgi:hypothetical protein
MLAHFSPDFPGQRWVGKKEGEKKYRRGGALDFHVSSISRFERANQRLALFSARFSLIHAVECPDKIYGR